MSRPIPGPLEPRARMIERERHALVAGMALLALAVIMTLFVVLEPMAAHVQAVDDRWMGWITSQRASWLTTVATGFKVAGSPAVTFPLRAAVVVLLAARRRWLSLGAFVGAVACSELCIGPLKALIDRPRPAGSLVATTGASYPSGHAIAASVTAFGVVFVVLRCSPRRLVWVGVAAACAGLMALSRTYLAAHWMSDVLGGTLFGTGWALVWPAGLEMVRDRREAAGARVRASTTSAGPAAGAAGAAGVGAPPV